MMMRKCWEKMPDNRLSFKELHMNTSKHIEHIRSWLRGYGDLIRLLKWEVIYLLLRKRKEGEGNGSAVASQVTPGPVSVQISATKP